MPSLPDGRRLLKCRPSQHRVCYSSVWTNTHIHIHQRETGPLLFSKLTMLCCLLLHFFPSMSPKNTKYRNESIHYPAVNSPFGFPCGCLPYTLITCWSTINCASLSWLSPCLKYFPCLIMFTLSCFRCQIISMHEAFIKLQIRTRLEEMCLIISTEWWWCAVVLPFC